MCVYVVGLGHLPTVLDTLWGYVDYIMDWVHETANIKDWVHETALSHKHQGLGP